MAVIPVIATEVAANKNVPTVIVAILLMFLASIVLAVMRAVLIVRELAGVYITKRRKRKWEDAPVIEAPPVVAGKFYDALYKPRSW